MSIERKVVIVTGASSGIGEATALLLAAQGAKLVLGARRPEALEDLVSRIAEAGGEAVSVSTDVSRREEVSALVDLAMQRYGKLDVYVGNAGVMPISRLEELRVDEWEAMIDVNLKGFLYGIAEALPIFRRQGFGHFVNVASTSGHKVVPKQAVYAGTKFAVRAISEGLRQEAGDKLRVTVISPGMTRTNFSDTISDDGTKAELEELRDRIAMPPEAVAKAIAFAIDQPDEVDVGEIVIRPTAQA
ncbi:oxidoreductase [Saccharibacillus sp. O23]|uniref:SDR family oxidoreductase n=1 Tax=Saccharibacillus sp. O23 TaxID=2009338 RepID=UPI000B4E0B82|nr:SDR family oxidoreductase [Saccharibacillus sp. O23]OWR32674.1 oxidoreductase [Saccharibacillus sp. O23]